MMSLNANNIKACGVNHMSFDIMKINKVIFIHHYNEMMHEASFNTSMFNLLESQLAC